MVGIKDWLEGVRSNNGGERGALACFSNGQNREVEEEPKTCPLGRDRMGIYTSCPNRYGYGRHCRPGQTGLLDMRSGWPVKVWNGYVDLRS
jgi:hypothetical protein